MGELVKREPKPVDVLSRLDRMFEDWTRAMSMRWPMLAGAEFPAERMIRVDEFRDNGDLVIRAELPGIDPDRDVELTVSDSMLHIDAERREEERVEEKGYLRHELRCGSFSRTLPLPEGATESDVKASYKDGILEIRVPTQEPPPPKKIEVTRG
jgi:HSP20 family protein